MPHTNVCSFVRLCRDICSEPRHVPCCCTSPRLSPRDVGSLHTLFALFVCSTRAGTLPSLCLPFSPRPLVSTAFRSLIRAHCVMNGCSLDSGGPTHAPAHCPLQEPRCARMARAASKLATGHTERAIRARARTLGAQVTQGGGIPSHVRRAPRCGQSGGAPQAPPRLSFPT